MRLEGKILVITGGASGIGRELVLQSLARGAQVAAVDLREEGLEALASLAGAGRRLSIHVADVTSRARVATLPQEVAALHGAVDGLINNAGIIQPFVRIGELTFNASLLTQMRAIDYINRLVAAGAVTDPHCRAVRVHRIDGGTALQAYPGSSRGSADAVMIQRLFEAGRAAAHVWLRREFDAVGQRSTVDIRRDYLDDTRMEVPSPRAAPAVVQTVGFKPWLARLLRQARGS